MQYNLIVTEDAEYDIEQAMDWYETQEVELGTKYVLSVRATIALIIKNPLAYMMIYRAIRKANTKKFPYSLYYSVNEADKLVTIFAVIHTSRSDKVWKQRIND